MTVDLEAMIKAQYELQLRLGNDFVKMSDNERIAYIREGVLACEDELHEMMQEVGWKSWATSRHINRDAAFGELRDAWQFLTNLMFAVSGQHPVEVARRLESELYQKLQKNHQRADRGYDGVSDKCPQCKRALDDVSSYEIYNPDDKMYETYCGECTYLIGKSLGPA